MNEVDTSKQKTHVHIHPTVGRVVHFHLGDPNQGPYPGWGLTPDGSNTYCATVAYVHNANMVNLSVCDANGIQMGFTSIPLIQDDDERTQLTQGERHIGHWCEWVPHQRAQAALERQIAHETRAAGAEDRMRERVMRDTPRPEHWPASGQPAGEYAGTTAAMTWNAPSDQAHPVHAATQALNSDGNAT